MTLEVKILKMYDDVVLPEQKTSGSAGFDIYARLDQIDRIGNTIVTNDLTTGRKYIVLQPFQRIMIGTGLKTQMPEGYELQIRPRSGLAIKHGLTLINCLGTIDSDFTDEICLLMVNLSTEPAIIEHNTRVAQGVFAKYEQPEFKLVTELDKTDRVGGFGSTGIKGV